MEKFNTALRHEYHQFCAWVSAFHEDDRGDNENLGRMLILALILVPIVILLAIFGDEIVTQAKTIWTDVMGRGIDPA